MPLAIETEQLSKSYPRLRRYHEILLHPWRKEVVRALENVNLELESGQVIGLLGPNGSGKTTLIKLLCNLVLPSGGRALVEGMDVTRETRRIRRITGLVVSDDRSFFWRLTGRQNLEFFAALNNLSGTRRRGVIDHLVDLVDLRDHANRMFKDYSSGLKQRLAIARALLPDPRILFLDEPTRTLDPIFARQLRRLIKEILVGEQRRTVVFSTNNVFEGEGLFDHIVILDRGTVRLSTSARALPGAPRTSRCYLLRTHESSERIEQVRASDLLPGGAGIELVDSGDDRETSFRVRLNGSGESISGIVEILVRSGVRVNTCEQEEMSLDELFRAVVQPGASLRN